MKRYEGMFLFDNTSTHQWSDMEAEVRRLCDRIQADLQVCVKFDERKLAYEIKGRKRGTYVLTYFDAEPERIGELERDAQLSELLLRILVVRSDQLSEARLAELKAWPPEQPLQPFASEGRRGEGGPPWAKPQPKPKESVATDKAEDTAKAVTEAATDVALDTATETMTTGGTAPEPEPATPTTMEEPPVPETPESKPADE